MFKHLLVIFLLSPLSVFAAEIEFLNKGSDLPKGLPFSEVVRVDDTYYLSGKVGIIPGTMTLAKGGIKGETKQVMDSIKATLAAYDLTTANLVKCLVMLADISEWADFNEVYKTYFTDHYPARSAFAAGGLALGARVEVECIAAASD